MPKAARSQSTARLRASAINPLQLPQMVMKPFRNRIQFFIESLLLSGTLARLLVAAALIFLVAVLMGLLGFLVTIGTGQFANPLEAVWWAFLRLSDPGYLGDDEGLALRTVSTIVTVAGYVLFLGVLVAILTQGLNEHIRRLEMGLAPISAKRHIIILGWSSRVPNIVRDLMASEQRVKRFLRRIGARRLQLVLLLDEVTVVHTSELRTHLGRDWNAREVILRSGSPLRSPSAGRLPAGQHHRVARRRPAAWRQPRSFRRCGDQDGPFHFTEHGSHRLDARHFSSRNSSTPGKSRSRCAVTMDRSRSWPEMR